MKKLPLLLLCSLLGGCVSADDLAQRRLADQSVLAVNWMQHSGEYQALTLQSFNLATQAFSAAPTDKPRAVVVDLDETMINNIPYFAWSARQGTLFDMATWSQWSRTEQAEAIPGAVDFANYVTDHGGKMFYVSNRVQADYAATKRNLLALGFPNVDSDTLLLKTGNSNKRPRFDQILSQGYRIVLFVGDNLNDFGSLTWQLTGQQRRDFVQQQAAQFGSQFIILPNPIYGDWEGGIKANYLALSKAEKLKARDAALRAWKPDSAANTGQ